MSMAKSNEILDSVAEDYDEPVLDLKVSMESLYLGPMVGASQKSRAAFARTHGVKGSSILSDNVGIVSILAATSCFYFYTSY